jgi:FkbM family methyltransferase
MSFRRFLKSVAWRLMPYADLDWQTSTGLRLRVRDKSEWSCLNEIFVDRVYDSFFRQLSGVRGWVDLGCNVGFFTLALLDHLRRQTPFVVPERVVLVDASEGCVRVTRDNLDVCGLTPQCAVRHGVIGPTGQSVEFHEFQYAVASGIFSRQRGERIHRYPTTPLADLLAGETAVFDLIKVDIEGAERLLFEQETPVMQRFRFGISEWHEPTMSGRQLHGACAQAGFEVLGFASQAIEYDLRRGHSLESPLGMLWWHNPKLAG